MDLFDALDWIQEFQSYTTDLYRCNPPMTKTEKQQCVKWVESNIINGEYNDRLDKIERALNYWRMGKSDKQIEDLVFCVLDKYLIWFLRLPTVELLREYINSEAKVLEQYIKKYGNNLGVTVEDLYLYITDILWSLVYDLGDICKSIGIDIFTIQSRSKVCRLPLAEFIGIPSFANDPTSCQLQQNWQDYIIGANKDAWINLIREELNNAGNKNGRLMAVIILALRKNSAIKTLTSKKRFYDALRAEFPNLNSDTAINKYLNAESPNSYTPPIPKDEIIAIINKLGYY